MQEHQSADAERPLQITTGDESNIHPSAKIDPTAKIDEDARIGAGCEIGAYTTVEENVVICDNTKIGARSTIKELVRIGKDSSIGDGVHVNQMIGDRVEVGHGSTLEGDQPGEDFNEIGDDVKIGKKAEYRTPRSRPAR